LKLGRVPVLSRRHCQLTVGEKNLTVRDLGSSNGTFVNGQKVEENPIQAGDFIRLGPVMFALQINGQPEKISPPTQPNAADDDTMVAAADGTEVLGDAADLDSSGAGLDDLDLDDLDLDDLDLDKL
ncbi:FHA domain-containing protein, partial [Planctomycetota bacterium]